MRGRTLSDAFVILDEAQNTTPAQMKMFLTRFGMRSRMVVCGDPKQVDLPEPGKSGLADAVAKMEGIDGKATVRFNAADAVRDRKSVGWGRSETGRLDVGGSRINKKKKTS